MKKIIFRIKSNNQGYTIVELLAVTAIIVIIAGLIAGVLTSTIRGGSRTRITSDVSQSGNYALSVMSNTIISSESVTMVGGAAYSDCTGSPSGTSISLKQNDASIITFSCSNNTIASQSANMPAPISLIDNDILIAQACSFTCRQDNNDSLAIPIIDISFSLKQKANPANFESKSSASFSTSTSMRNYNPK